jgi:hypothetical protein
MGFWTKVELNAESSSTTPGYHQNIMCHSQWNQNTGIALNPSRYRLMKDCCAMHTTWEFCDRVIQAVTTIAKIQALRELERSPAIRQTLFNCFDG